MTRRLYVFLLRLHPKPFRQRFGEEMIEIFDRSDRKSSLIADGFVSYFRQWTLRNHATAFSATVATDGVPLFYSAEPEIPRAGAFMNGALIALLAFGSMSLIMNHRWKQTNVIVGSHHPSPSHILGAHTLAKAESDLPAEVKMPAYPFHPAVSPYFRLMLVLGVLDADQDNVISAAEMENAASALWKLDKNHDGKLTAEECGLKPDSSFDLGRARLMFMRIHPVLAALDVNRDGEISESEIRNAARSLRALDADGDGKLTERELLPDRAVSMAANIILMLDKDGDGRISRSERTGRNAERLRAILDRAERNGFVTEDALALELARGGDQ